MYKRQTLAVTEHYPLTPAFDPKAYLAMPQESVRPYLEALEAARAAYPDIEILLGTELDWLGDCEDRDLSDEDLAPFEIVLGSVHFVDAWPFDDPAQRGRWDEPGAADAIWKRYFELWCDAVTSTRPFTVMSHPDLAKKFGHYPSYDVGPVSYTHLDVYKRQAWSCARRSRTSSPSPWACPTAWGTATTRRRSC